MSGINIFLPTRAKNLLRQKPLTLWRGFTNNQRQRWSQYLGLFPINWALIRSSRHYGHRYQYQLVDSQITKVVFCLVLAIVQYCNQNRMTRVFFAMSGGLDSSTICGLLARARQLAKDLKQPFSAYGLGLPIQSNPEHHKRAQITARRFNIPYILVTGLDPVYKSLTKPLNKLATILRFNKEDLRKGLGNSKARLRMIVNFFATTKSGCVISTDNLSELYMAFWTLMGDVGAFGPIQHVLKGLELPAIASALGVPNAILTAKPTDGLAIHKSLDQEEGGDADAFGGITYPHLDAIICHAVKAGLRLDTARPVKVNSSKIDSNFATQQAINRVIAQMVSPASVWKRVHGSIGTAPTRTDLGLKPLRRIVSLLEKT